VARDGLCLVFSEQDKRDVLWRILDDTRDVLWRETYCVLSSNTIHIPLLLVLEDETQYVSLETYCEEMYCVERRIVSDLPFLLTHIFCVLWKMRHNTSLYVSSRRFVERRVVSHLPEHTKDVCEKEWKIRHNTSLDKYIFLHLS